MLSEEEKMSNNSEMLKILRECNDSCFSVFNYNINVGFGTFVGSMLLHTWFKKKVEEEERRILRKDSGIKNNEFNLAWLEKITPGFQRDNDKWTVAMKTKFIENILKGASTELFFFKMNEKDDAAVIDGLQRTTAIVEFFNGKIKPFGKSIKEIEPYLEAFNTKVKIRIYLFKEWEEVGKFYVDMNENITHSKNDIKKAKDWFLREKNIVL